MKTVHDRRRIRQSSSVENDDDGAPVYSNCRQKHPFSRIWILCVLSFGAAPSTRVQALSWSTNPLLWQQRRGRTPLPPFAPSSQQSLLRFSSRDGTRPWHQSPRRQRRQSSSELQMVVTVPQGVFEDVITQNLLDDLINESIKTRATRDIMMQFDPSSGWVSHCKTNAQV